MADQPLLPGLKIETLTPHECGWVRIGQYTWEKPNGDTHIFAPGQRQLIEKLVTLEDE